MPFRITALPFASDALEPLMSCETVDLHHRHHGVYVDRLNELVDGTELEDATLETILCGADGPLLDLAGQHYDHSFYWSSLRPPRSSSGPTGVLAERIATDFGSLANLKRTFVAAGLALIGSGWCWLTRSFDGRLSIVTTANAETPVADGLEPLLVCDLWEHAYYLDFRSERAHYLEAFWILANWEFAATRYGVRPTTRRVQRTCL